MTERLSIDRLGAHGDGIAQGKAGAVFVPFALPGETVSAEVSGDRGTLLAVERPSSDRVDPACTHFGTCGACALQHLGDGAYRAWKRERLVEALAARDIDTSVGSLVPCLPGTRRRVTYAAIRTIAGVVLGYRKALSHEIVDIVEDPIARPAIVGSLDALRTLAGTFRGKGALRMTVTASDSGLDVAVADAGRLDDVTRRALGEAALRARLARLSVDGEVIVEPRKPSVTFGRVTVSPPPGGFLQATAEAEEAMAGLVVAHLGRAKRGLDLFAGSGAFALRLAERSEVHAVEAEAGALDALDTGFRHAPGLRRVTGERRDLFRRPLLARELDAFGGLVFDPPRAGAEEQARQIARSAVPLVAAVSCNPVTLARDLRILLDGGYTLTGVTPVDQFLWSPHVEAVALLERPRRRR